MIRPGLDLARTSDALCFIADYHALTTLPPPDSVRERALDVAATLIAFGLDPERTVLYRQSDVPEICELTWILSCACQKGLLNRAHADKAAVQENLAAGRDRDQGVGMGLFNYPILMADILILRAGRVPVGSDQRQHVEIARDLAGSFNRVYGPCSWCPSRPWTSGS
jgi:tryptophanyl-tRNA synthetase